METVKITSKIFTEQKVSIELPRYFRALQTYYMVLNEGQILAVSDFDKPHYKSAGLLSCIRHESVSRYYYDNASNFEPITEEEFREAFVKVSVELEALMN